MVFSKDSLGEFKSQGKYVINGMYEFEMTVTGRSTAVELELSGSEMKFQFEEGSLEFSTERELKLYNPGNSSAYFKFLLNKDRLFSPKLLEGNLQSKQ